MAVPTLACLLTEPQFLTAASLCLLGGVFSQLPLILGKDCFHPLSEVTFPTSPPSGRFQSYFWPINSDQLSKMPHPVAVGKSLAKHCRLRRRGQYAPGSGLTWRGGGAPGAPNKDCPTLSCP